MCMRELYMESESIRNMKGFHFLSYLAHIMCSSWVLCKYIFFFHWILSWLWSGYSFYNKWTSTFIQIAHPHCTRSSEISKGPRTWAHGAIYRWSMIKLYTWSLYIVLIEVTSVNWKKIKRNKRIRGIVNTCGNEKKKERQQ